MACQQRMTVLAHRVKVNTKNSPKHSENTGFDCGFYAIIYLPIKCLLINTYEAGYRFGFRF
jgi:hypothetical protein